VVIAGRHAAGRVFLRRVIALDKSAAAGFTLLAVVGSLHSNGATLQRRSNNFDSAKAALALFQFVKAVKVDLNAEHLVEAAKISVIAFVVGVNVLATGVKTIGGIYNFLTKHPALCAL
jgi:hypothetical protein